MDLSSSLGVWLNHQFSQTPQFLSEIWLKFWNLEALIWVENGVDYIRLLCKFPKFSHSWPKSISIFGTHKKDPRVQKSAKSAILTSSMTVELLLVERSIVQSTNTNTNTQEYPRVKKIPENTRPYISTLLPDPNLTRYPVFFPIPDPTCSAQGVPEPDPLPSIFFDTRPDPIQFWKSSGSG